MKGNVSKQTSRRQGLVKVFIFFSAIFVGVVLSLRFMTTFPADITSPEIKLGVGVLAGLSMITLFLTALMLRFSLFFRGMITIASGLFLILFVMLFVPIGHLIKVGAEIARPDITQNTNTVAPIAPAQTDDPFIVIADFIYTNADETGQVIRLDLVPLLYETLVNQTHQQTIQVARLAKPVSSSGEAEHYRDFYGASVLIWGTYEQGFVMPHLAVSPKLPVMSASDLDTAYTLEPIHQSNLDVHIQYLSHLLLGITYADPHDIHALQQALRHFNRVQYGWQANLWRGNSYYWLGGIEQALESYNQAIALNADQPILHHNRALILAQQQQYEQALKGFDQALQLDNNYQRAYRHRAQTLTALGEFSSALADYDQAIALKGDDYLAYAGRGNVYGSLQEFPEAIVNYDQAITLFAADPQLYIHRGNAYSALEDYEAAIEDYGQALQRNADNPIPFIHRGNAHVVIGSYEQAINDYSSAIMLRPNQSDYYAYRASAYSVIGDQEAAVDDYTQAIVIDPDNAALYVNRAHISNARQDYDSALADYNQAVTLDAGDSAIWQSRGNLKILLEDYWGAISDYSQAINLSPFDATILVARGNAYSTVFEYEAAIEDYSEAIALDPSYALAYTNRGAVYGTLWQYGWATRQQAIIDYQTALGLIADPDWYNDTALALQGLRE
ncbi:MAG: tetratricopeptide repeat protein [Chloroflexota bacterium]